MTEIWQGTPTTDAEDTTGICSSCWAFGEGTWDPSGMWWLCDDCYKEEYV